MTIRDEDGVVLIFAGRPNYSVVTEISPKEMDRGRYTSVSVAGRFHNDRRQNDSDQLARWESLGPDNEREDHLLILHAPFPRYSMEGYVRNLQGPKWIPRTRWFGFTFDFNAPKEPRLINRFPGPDINFAQEGRRYASVSVDVDHSNLEDLIHDVRRRTHDDHRMIRQTISDEMLTPSQALDLGLGTRRIPIR